MKSEIDRKTSYPINIYIKNMTPERKNSFQIIFKDEKCKFFPNEDVSFEKQPDRISGKVLYVEQGEYNPISWYKPIVVKKSDLLQEYNHFSSFLKRIGFTPNPYDQCVFNCVRNGKQLTLTMHVDDGIATCEDLAQLQWLDNEIRKEFNMDMNVMIGN